MIKEQSTHLSITAVMLQRKSQHIWGTDNWSLLGLLPDVSEQIIHQAESDGTVHYLTDFVLQLYPLHCDSYYHNLMSGKPQVYVISQEGSDLKPVPILMTVDYDEAAAYMETGEQVVNADLPENLCQWLERFVLTHYQPEEPKKRRRQQWHNGEQKNDSKTRK